MNNMIRSIIYKFVFLFLLAISVSGQELSHIAGAFADLNLGVRPSGLGGAYTALSNDGNALLYNPAATTFTPYVGLTATTTKIYNIVPATFLGVHYPFERMSIVGGIQQVGDDLLKETTFGLAAAMRGDELFDENFKLIPWLDQMAFSLSLRFLLANFGDNADGGEERVRGDGRGFALDFGYYFKMNGLRIGATMRDALAYFRWNSSVRGHYSQNPPRRLRVGMAYVQARMRFSLDVQPAIYEDVNTRIFSGIEVNILPWLVLRSGLAQNTGGLFHNKIWTTGFGVYNMKWQQFRLALQAGYRTDELDNSIRFAIDIFWPPN
ncbi:MAG: hypothetical protein DWQ05_11540 [Calditrichaeota bacterium]|nr:MAG: hypothetical protein DWQ05_11540 [Calditrichota bacterium]